MDCINRVGCVTILGLALIAGCNKGASSDAATAQNGQASDAVPDAIAKAAAQAAADFVDAVIKGDGQRASARLTPQAMERIIASGLPFSPPGLSSATYRMGEVVPIARPGGCPMCPHRQFGGRQLRTTKKCAACCAASKTTGVCPGSLTAWPPISLGLFPISKRARAPQSHVSR